MWVLGMEHIYYIDNNFIFNHEAILLPTHFTPIFYH